MQKEGARRCGRLERGERMIRRWPNEEGRKSKCVSERVMWNRRGWEKGGWERPCVKWTIYRSGSDNRLPWKSSPPLGHLSWARKKRWIGGRRSAHGEKLGQRECTGQGVVQDKGRVYTQDRIGGYINAGRKG